MHDCHYNNQIHNNNIDMCNQMFTGYNLLNILTGHTFLYEHDYSICNMYVHMSYAYVATYAFVLIIVCLVCHGILKHGNTKFLPYTYIN